MKLFKTAQYIEEQQMFNPLEGKTKAQARNIVRKLIYSLPINGKFSDSYWQGPKIVWDAFNNKNIDWNLSIPPKYEKDEQGNPIRKKWQFEIDFVNKKGRPDKLYGIMIAYGAGSVQQPLDAYDMTVSIN